MVPSTVRKAIEYLERKTDGAVDREAVVSYAVLDAYVHYYPSLADAHIRDLRARFDWIRDREPSRWIRQRRIALTHILAEVGPMAA
jgi:hypothetical protein